MNRTEGTGPSSDEHSETVAVDKIAVGDRLLVRPGEVVPVDAYLETEVAEFDESSLTGESLPVLHAAGELVASGVVNGSTAVIMRAAAIAGLAWYVSGDAVRFAEVLVVATPCPLLIAAPVAFDKTGTLTQGQPELRTLRTAKGFTDEQLLQFAGSAEVYSSHELAAAVVEAVKDRSIPLIPTLAAEEHATNGVEARVEAGVIRVGKPAWIGGFEPSLERVHLGPGELAIYVSLDDQFVGTLIMQDQLREEAAAMLAELRELGIERFAMVTGDVHATAESVAAELGIDEVHAETSPEGKVRIAASMQPRPLLMVGDGLNDAPVLAAADVGFAMGARGATAASESADIVNRFDRIDSVATAVRIGRDTVRIALESIWAGILISVGLMLVAAFGYLPAIAGAWLQEVVDLVAILGALRAVREPKRRWMP